MKQLNFCAGALAASLAAVALSGTGCSEDPAGGSAASGPALSAVSAAGLLAGYGFSEGAGTTTADAAGNGLAGRLSRASWVAGHSGSGIGLDGVSGYVDLGNPAALSITGSLTVSAWVNESANVGDDGIIVAKSSGGGGWELKSSPDTGTRTFALGIYTPGGAYVGRYSSVTRSLGTWYHVAGVYDATARTLHIYVNGTLADGALWGTVPAAIANPTVNASIGRRDAGYYLKGTIDDVRIYRRALGQAEIQADLASPVDAPTANFDFRLTGPGAISVIQGSTASGPVTTTLLAGTTQQVALSASGLPAGAGATFTPATCAPPCTSTLSVTSSASTPLGSTTVAVTGTAGGVAHTATFALTVLPASGDTQPPTGAVLVNGGAAATKAAAVTLTLSATDGQGAVAQMRFSNDGSTWSAPEPFAVTKAWTLATGDGVKTVYAQFKDVAGNWSGSFTATIVLDTTAPATSSVAVSRVLGTSATVTWTTNEIATSQVEYGPNTSYGSLTPLDPTLVTSHQVILANLAPGTRYYYRTRSIDAAGNERIGSRLSFTTATVTDTTPPSVPTGLLATAVSTSRIDLSWIASTDAVGVTGYRIYRNGVLAGTTSATTFASAGLTPGTAYVYAVAAYDGAGNVSALSSSAGASTLTDSTPPSVPTGVGATAVSASGIEVTWAASSDDTGVTGYEITRDGLTAASVIAPRFSDNGLAAASTHAYRVRAFDSAGNQSDWSLPVSATTFNASTGATPTLVQHLASTQDPVGFGDDSGNNFKFTLPNPVLPGNVLVLAVHFATGATFAGTPVADTNGTWPTSPTIRTTGGNSEDMAVFVLPNAAAGVHTLTVNFTAAVNVFSYRVSEFNNIATASPVSGTHGAVDVNSFTLAAGSFTPTNNDSSGGNLILTYVQEDDVFGHEVTNFAPGPGASLLDADIYYHSGAAVSAASQYQIQTTAAAINPSITATLGSASPFNVVSVALKVASAGTAPGNGIRIVRALHFEGGSVSGSTMQVPTSGNLFVWTFTQGADLTDVTSITDTASNTWTKYRSSGDLPLFMVAANATPSNSLKLTIHTSPSYPQAVLFYDIAGAAASPVGAIGSTNFSAFGTTAIDFPSITPTQAAGLTIVSFADGQGPVTGFYTGAPANAIFDGVLYTGQTDASEMDHSDGRAHLFTTDTSVEHWNWTTIQADAGSAQAIHFKQR